MAQQKLYTEEEVLNALALAHSHITSLQNIIERHLHPIELPSDEEIDKVAKDKIRLSNDCFGEYDFTVGKQDGFYEGAIWMRDKIINK